MSEFDSGSKASPASGKVRVSPEDWAKVVLFFECLPRASSLVAKTFRWKHPHVSERWEMNLPDTHRFLTETAIPLGVLHTITRNGNLLGVWRVDPRTVTEDQLCVRRKLAPDVPVQTAPLLPKAKAPHVIRAELPAPAVTPPVRQAAPPTFMFSPPPATEIQRLISRLQGLREQGEQLHAEFVADRTHAAQLKDAEPKTRGPEVTTPQEDVAPREEPHEQEVAIKVLQPTQEAVGSRAKVAERNARPPDRRVLSPVERAEELEREEEDAETTVRRLKKKLGRLWQAYQKAVAERDQLQAECVALSHRHSPDAPPEPAASREQNEPTREVDQEVEAERDSLKIQVQELKDQVRALALELERAKAHVIQLSSDWEELVEANGHLSQELDKEKERRAKLFMEFNALKSARRDEDGNGSAHGAQEPHQPDGASRDFQWILDAVIPKGFEVIVRYYIASAGEWIRCTRSAASENTVQLCSLEEARITLTGAEFEGAWQTYLEEVRVGREMVWRWTRRAKDEFGRIREIAEAIRLLQTVMEARR